jgi:DNA-binding NtrC family response regulator
MGYIVIGGPGNATKNATKEEGCSRCDCYSTNFRRRRDMSEDVILLVEDDAQQRAALGEFLSSKGMKVLSAANCLQAEHMSRTQRPDAAILDYELPDGTALDLMPRVKAIDPALPVIILTGQGSIELAVEAVKLGADQFLTKPADFPTLLVLLQRSLEIHRTRQVQLADRSHTQRDAPDPFLGTSTRIRELAAIAQKVVETNSPVLIQGETGSGKGVLARWLHQNGPRASRPFVDLNCAGLSKELLETELFGHEKGAFTGAVQNKVGLLEISHKGTIFLDEIGDLDLHVQPKLLKVLEEKTFRRLGDVRERLVDVRLIAATHRNLRELVGRKAFRDDLYFRINTICLSVPPLRERTEDIPLLAAQLLGRVSVDLSVRRVEISDEAMRYLQAYPWPGNVRELRNILERAVLLGDGKTLYSRDLHFDVQADSDRFDDGSITTLEEVEKRYIARALKILRGRVPEVAQKLGIPRSSLYNKIKQYRIALAGKDDSRTAEAEVPAHPELQE